MKALIGIDIDLRHIAVFLLLAATVVCCRAGGMTVSDSLINELNRTIADRDVYRSQKEDRLLELRRAGDNAASDTDRFAAMGALLDEYVPYNTDSAFAICRRREALAHRIGDQVFIDNARLNTANILGRTGMYKEAIEILDRIDCGRLPDYLQRYYFHVCRTIYGLLADYSVRAEDKRRYDALTMQYRDSLLACNTPGDLGYVINMADKLNNTGHPREAIEIIEEHMRSGEITTHEKAICAFTMAASYKQLGDLDKEKECLIVSSVSDLRAAVREYESLRQLAILLYQEGDVEMAHELLGISINDAAECNARLRVLELNDIYPLVNEMYLDTIKRQKSNLRWSVVVISLLALVLLALVFYVLRQMRRIAAARKEVETANRSLHQLNSELKKSNAELCEANRAIAENSYLKEEYIGRYMDQCLVYIEKLDSYRKSLAKMVGAGKIEQLGRTLKSTLQVDEELKAFYDNFDATFLKLFPTFVDDFNALLRPEEAIIPKRDGHLNTELRIFALIRLGITDSVKIAQFLRYSLTTIYNYRTKIRNKAAGDRNKLEEEIQKIGRAAV